MRTHRPTPPMHVNVSIDTTLDVSHDNFFALYRAVRGKEGAKLSDAVSVVRFDYDVEFGEQQ